MRDNFVIMSTEKALLESFDSPGKGKCNKKSCITNIYVCPPVDAVSMRPASSDYSFSLALIFYAVFMYLYLNMNKIALIKKMKKHSFGYLKDT